MEIIFEFFLKINDIYIIEISIWGGLFVIVIINIFIFFVDNIFFDGYKNIFCGIIFLWWCLVMFFMNKILVFNYYLFINSINEINNIWW